MSKSIPNTQPKGLLRFLLRMPILLYKLRLGWLLDGRFLMLIHTGRLSGLQRKVVLEVVKHDEKTNSHYVAAGWRGHADWFMNIIVNPEVQVFVSHSHFYARASVVPLLEAAATFYYYAQNNPFAFSELSRFMMNEQLSPSQVDCFRLAETVPLVKLIPNSANK